MGVAGRGRLGSHGSRFLWVGFGLTRIPQISQVLLLRVGNLTEVGGHFRPTPIPLLWVDLGSHRFNRFNKNIRMDSGKNDS